MNDKIILDLCGGTGSWSEPYRQQGYDVRLITLPEHDVRLYVPPENVYGILAAPPCTHFSSSGARWWKAKGEAALLEGLSVVDACMRIIYKCQPKFWVLENPVGRLRHWVGAPTLIFDPWEFGDPYTKKTLLWGNFNLPIKTPCEPLAIPSVKRSNNPKMGFPSKMPLLPPAANRATLRSITPPGFAKAFMEVNR